MNLSAKTKTLESILRELNGGVMAVSGGLDSRTLFLFASHAGTRFTPLFFHGPHMTPGESAKALAWLSEHHPEPVTIEIDLLDQPEVRANTKERCYYCKSSLFRAAADAARELGVFTILDGTNASDHSEFRPGIRALDELGIRSPLAEAGLTKPEVRELAREIGLDRSEQPARACLLTRFDYNIQPERELMFLIGRAEDALMELGFKNFRLRAPSADTLLLQIAEAEQSTYKNRKAAVDAVLSDLSRSVEVKFTEKVSGYYDKKD